jgi:hypothetical protein
MAPDHSPFVALATMGAILTPVLLPTAIASVRGVTPLTPRPVEHRRGSTTVLHARTPDAHARTRARVRASILAVPSVPTDGDAAPLEGARRR